MDFFGHGEHFSNKLIGGATSLVMVVQIRLRYQAGLRSMVTNRPG
jgi:hypothetical protein